MKNPGTAVMADVSGKPATEREAVAEGWVLLSPSSWRMVREGKIPKGDVLAVARIAGIMAAKATPRILPLCHPIPLSQATVDFSLPGTGSIRVVSRVRTVAPTGVEMEALTAVSAAALSIYDMVKPVDRGIEITGIRLLRKTGGKSGDYLAPATGRRISLPMRSASRADSLNSPGKSGRAAKRSR
ncbi:MAG: cyclic pyranopterin monophosphate synthase MoaC [Deltaproteobacteria bacterium]|nr:cyclic pyranopterin monophosphate synthase MoaC [Deltaproteobacteria bacterium]